MAIFQSMTNVTVYIVLIVIVMLTAALRRNPFVTAGIFVQEIFTSRKYILHFISMIAILFFNKLELSIEKNMKYHADFTPVIHKLEGDFVANLQHMFATPVLTYILAFFYVVVFPAMLISSIGIYTTTRNYRLFYALIYAMMMNYLIAIPFYLFFPVNEVWSFHPKVDFLMLDVFPSFENEYRPLSGLNNCFPSLHTSISVTIALIASKSDNLFWKRFTAVSAVVIIFSIFYLGIHWLTDMMGGLVLAWTASQVGLKIADSPGLLNYAKLQRHVKQHKLGD